MGEDNAEVLKAITTLTEKVEQYHGDFREFRGEYKTKIESMAKNIETEKMWQRIQMGCVLPVVGVMHQIAAHFGWIK